MEVKIISSGSMGNSYILRCGKDTLLVECGVPTRDILSGLAYSIDEGVSGCVVSHIHTDHILARTANDLYRYGVPMYGNSAVAKKFGFVKVLDEKRPVSVGKFKVTSLPVPHGECACCSFVIDTPDKQRVLFATDLESFPYTVRGVNHLMVEANYSEDILMKKLLDNEDVRSKSDTHMEFGETRCVISRHIWSGLRSVTLLHLSRNLSDSVAFRSDICQLLSGKGVVTHVYVARNGLDLSLRRYPWEL